MKEHSKKNISFAEKCPELAEEWDYEKNNISPFEISYGSGKYAWWICKNGHKWRAQILNRTYGRGCP